MVPLTQFRARVTLTGLRLASGSNTVSRRAAIVLTAMMSLNQAPRTLLADRRNKNTVVKTLRDSSAPFLLRRSFLDSALS